MHRPIGAGEYLVEWMDVKTGDVALSTVVSLAAGVKLHGPAPGEYLLYIHAPQSVDIMATDVPLVEGGKPAALFIGPDDVPYGAVSFVRDKPDRVYGYIKDVVEKIRLASGASLAIYTANEISQLEEIRQNIVLVGSATLNSHRQFFDNMAGTDATRPYRIVANPWHPEFNVVLVEGDNAEDIATALQMLTVNIK